ncbi:MAG: hypothetical protein ABW019_10730 [Chitinophagaceae bacterium]
MKKLSLSWKFLLVFSYFELVAFGLCQIALVFSVFTSRYSTAEDYRYFSLFTVALLLICLNRFFNIYVLHRYYPDTPVPRKLKRWMITIGVLNILLWIGLLLACLDGIRSVFVLEAPYINRQVYISLALACLLWIIGVYTLFLQFSLFAMLKKNSQHEWTTLIRSIGS